MEPHSSLIPFATRGNKNTCLAEIDPPTHLTPSQCLDPSHCIDGHTPIEPPRVVHTGNYNDVESHQITEPTSESDVTNSNETQRDRAIHKAYNGFKRPRWWIKLAHNVKPGVVTWIFLFVGAVFFITLAASDFYQEKCSVWIHDLSLVMFSAALERKLVQKMWGKREEAVTNLLIRVEANEMHLAKFEDFKAVKRTEGELIWLSWSMEWFGCILMIMRVLDMLKRMHGHGSSATFHN